MTLLQMKYFYTLCKLENYIKTAEKMHVSQPAISKAIRDLEDECGMPLVLRRGNSLVITEEGKVLCDEVGSVLDRIEKIQYVVKNLSLERKYVRVGLSTFSGNAVFPRLRRYFHENYPEIEVFSREGVTGELFTLLDRGDVDVVITSPWKYFENNGRRNEYGCYKLAASELVFCVHKGHPLVGRRRVSLEDIVKEPLVMLNDNFSFTKDIKQSFELQGLVPDIIHYTSQMYTVERFVEQGAAAGFLPMEVARDNPYIEGIEFRERSENDTTIVWKAGHMKYDCVDKFIAAAKKLFPKKK